MVLITGMDSVMLLIWFFTGVFRGVFFVVLAKHSKLLPQKLSSLRTILISHYRSSLASWVQKFCHLLPYWSKIPTVCAWIFIVFQTCLGYGHSKNKRESESLWVLQKQHVVSKFWSQTLSWSWVFNFPPITNHRIKCDVVYSVYYTSRHHCRRPQV